MDITSELLASDLVSLRPPIDLKSLLFDKPAKLPHMEYVSHGNIIPFPPFLAQINSCSDDMLGIEPLELHFPIELNRQQSRSIQLTNDTDHYIAFMIGTTGLLAYRTQPNKEVVPPRCHHNVAGAGEETWNCNYTPEEG